MTKIYTTRTRWALWALSIVASALALVGFGTFAYSAQSSAAAQERLYQVIAELTANQMQLIAERDEIAGFLNAAREALLESANAERDSVTVQCAPPREGSVTCERRSMDAEVSRTGTLRNTLEKEVPSSMSEPGTVRSASRSSSARTTR